MPLVKWNPATKVSRGNVAVGVATAIANMSAPKVSELSDGLTLDCSITTFNGTSTTSSETVDWLCDTNSEQLPGSTTHAIDDLVIKGSGQSDTNLITGLDIGDVVYVWRRDGLDHDTAIAAAQMVWIWKVVITSIDPLEASNSFIGIVAHIAVQDRTPVPVAVINS